MRKGGCVGIFLMLTPSPKWDSQKASEKTVNKRPLGPPSGKAERFHITVGLALALRYIQEDVSLRIASAHGLGAQMTCLPSKALATSHLSSPLFPMGVIFPQKVLRPVPRG